MKKILLASAAAMMVLPATANAAATITVNFTSSSALPGNNDFKTQLTGLGQTRLTAGAGSSLFLNGPARVKFEFLGTESGFSDTVTSLIVGSISLTETSKYQNLFASPQLIGTQTYLPAGALNLAGLLNFTSNKGAPATVGNHGFGIFLGPNQVTGQQVTQLYFGYDDQISRLGPDDDDWDDFIVRATVSAIPEPATWAFMILGFGLVGAAMRRREKVSVRYA